MKKVKMTKIQTALGEEEIVIDEGWMANILEVKPASEAEITPYVRYFQRQGLKPADARAEVLRLVQELFEAEYVRRLRNSLRRWAREFYEENGTLAGFDPALLQNAFVPAQNFGRAGNEVAHDLMEEMAPPSTCPSCGYLNHLSWCPRR